MGPGDPITQGDDYLSKPTDQVFEPEIIEALGPIIRAIRMDHFEIDTAIDTTLTIGTCTGHHPLVRGGSDSEDIN